MAFDPEQYLADLSPARVSLSDVHVTSNEREVVAFAERLWAEGRAWQEMLALEQLFNRALDALASKHFIDRRDRTDRARIAVNFFRSIIERKISQLTDVAPVFEASSRSGKDWAADVAEDVMQAWWDEYSGQSFIDRVGLQAMLGGSAPAFCTWDKSLDSWAGDLRMQCLPTRQVVFDPYLSEARLLQSDASYVGVEIVRPLSEFRLYYKERGHLVQPQPGVSHFQTSADPGYTVGVGRPYRRQSRRGNELSSSAIPRATERRVYFRDLTLNPQAPFRSDGTPNLLFPRKRCIVYSWDKHLLADGDANNWDGKFPLEIFDWGMNLEHAYGESELESLWPMQTAVNLLVSGLIHNARLANEPPWIAEENSIDPAELDYWEEYADHPNSFHFYKPGRRPPEPRPPQQYPQTVLGTLSMLREGMELVSGIVPVTRGQTPGGGITAGVAIDSLQAAAAVTIRRASSRMNDWASRYGQLVLSRIVQYFADERVLYLTKHEHVAEVLQARQQFLESLVNAPSEREMEDLLLFAHRDLKVRVRPESGLGMAAAQKVMFMERQAAAGRVEPAEVLRAARVSDPEEKIEKAQEFQTRQGMKMAQIRAILGGGGPQGPGQGSLQPRPPQQQIEQRRRNGYRE